MKSEPYDYKCDLFSLRVTLYITLFKITPYGKLHMGFKGKFLQIINISDKLILIKTRIQTLDNLLEKLLELDPKKKNNF